jgi:hypothetical protein
MESYLCVLDVDLVVEALLLVLAGLVAAEVLLDELEDEAVELVEEVGFVGVGVAWEAEAAAEEVEDGLVLVAVDVAADVLVEVGDRVAVGEGLLLVLEAEVGAVRQAPEAGFHVVDFVVDCEVHLGHAWQVLLELQGLGLLLGLVFDILLLLLLGLGLGAAAGRGNRHALGLHEGPVDRGLRSHLVEATHCELLAIHVESVLFRSAPPQRRHLVLQLQHVLIVLVLLHLRHERCQVLAAVPHALAKQHALAKHLASHAATLQPHHAVVLALLSAKSTTNTCIKIYI